LIERIDQETGSREIAEFIGRGHQRVFGTRHRPSTDPVLGVIVCSGMQAEFHRNYRREVLLGRALADSGFCVQRFHYRGSGNSDGESADMTFSTMLEDAMSSAEWMRSQEDLEDVVFVGVRLGGLVAAAAASRTGSAPLVLWEPFAESRTYFRDILRAARVHELAKDAAAGPSQDAQLAELRRRGRLDVFGYSVDLRLYESVLARRLEDELGETARAVFLLSVSSSGNLKADYARIASQLETRRFDVKTHVVRMPSEPWWFAGGRSRREEARLTRELIRVTTEWIGRMPNLRGGST
jgi:alpha/beta superfamily hydrolase